MSNTMESFWFFLGGGVIRFIVKFFAECTTGKGPTFKSVKDAPPARCIYRDLQL